MTPKIKNLLSVSMRVVPEMTGRWDSKLRGKTLPECKSYFPRAVGADGTEGGRRRKPLCCKPAFSPVGVSIAAVTIEHQTQLHHTSSVDSLQGVSRPSVLGWGYIIGPFCFQAPTS